jgi:hypothetical protein
MHKHLRDTFFFIFIFVFSFISVFADPLQHEIDTIPYTSYRAKPLSAYSFQPLLSAVDAYEKLSHAQERTHDLLQRLTTTVSLLRQQNVIHCDRLDQISGDISVCSCYLRFATGIVKQMQFIPSRAILMVLNLNHLLDQANLLLQYAEIGYIHAEKINRFTYPKKYSQKNQGNLLRFQKMTILRAKKHFDNICDQALNKSQEPFAYSSKMKSKLSSTRWDIDGEFWFKTEDILKNV